MGLDEEELFKKMRGMEGKGMGEEVRGDLAGKGKHTPLGISQPSYLITSYGEILGSLVEIP